MGALVLPEKAPQGSASAGLQEVGQDARLGHVPQVVSIPAHHHEAAARVLDDVRHRASKEGHETLFVSGLAEPVRRVADAITHAEGVAHRIVTDKVRISRGEHVRGRESLI